MANHKPRCGSLQFWPRKRASSILPSANWKDLQKVYGAENKSRFLGFIGYKAGMIRVLARDSTPHSMTKGKQIVLPATYIECPPMKIFSVRFYKNFEVATEIMSENADKELKRVIKMQKKSSKKLEDEEKNLSNYEDIRVLVHSVAKKTGIKKTPDISEIALTGSVQQKFDFIKQNLGKEITIADVFGKSMVIDIKGLTKGKGTQGPVKKLGISLRQHKSEKGQRKAGSLGPWKPARLTFRAPLMGQLGFFTRIQYNNWILDVVNPLSNVNYKEGFPHYGMIRSDAILVKGSVSGPVKRQVLLLAASRPHKAVIKQNFEIVSKLK
ncbi:MAG: 50S ribosomal protein L3 [archaeon]